MGAWCDHNSRAFGTERGRRVDSVREHSQGSFCKNIGGIGMSLLHIHSFNKGEKKTPITGVE